MRLSHSLFLVLACVSLGACSTTPSISVPPVTCQGKEDCELKWGRSLKWVSDNVRYRIESANDMMIQTKGPIRYSVDAAVSLVKIPKGDGVYTIEFDAGCDNMFGCQPSVDAMRASFFQFVMGSSIQPSVGQ